MQPRQAALKVSADEASRTSDAAIKRLLSVKKLSLVVDLDQTIIHATVDPTVPEWQKDPNNPNYEALKDVRSFHLLDGGPGGRGCYYHIKLRPGLRQFLQDMSAKYDMHIYTMGTRPYAQNIAEIIDPDHKIFGDKILSRDESGSLTLKTLHKLFPMDQRMVVVIDDRGDIWNWSDNLIKVNPYDFFVGIGDVNSSFLPKRTDLGGKPPPPPPPIPAPAKIENGTASTDDVTKADFEPDDEEPSSSQASVSSIDQQLLAMSAGDNPAMIEERTHEQEEAIAAQIEDRPLLRKQEELDKQDEEEAKLEPNGETTSDTPSESGSQRHRHNLLRDDDIELKYLQQSLERVHQAFYDEYERRSTGSFGGRIAELRGDKYSKVRPGGELASVPHIGEIMPPIKKEVLKDVVLCFTGVIPQGTDHAT
jgi:RNA polymerase II subunit A C-terminal domain phosphatase